MGPRAMRMFLVYIFFHEAIKQNKNKSCILSYRLTDSHETTAAQRQQGHQPRTTASLVFIQYLVRRTQCLVFLFFCLFT